jgi:hypothetical protein
MYTDDPRLRFPFHTSEAPERGLSQDDLRSGRFHRPFHAVRALHLDDTDLIDVATSYLARMSEHAVFSHTTAARLLGLPLPLTHLGRQPLHVMIPAPHRAPRGRGVIGHQTSLPMRVGLVRGLPVAHPADVIRQCASLLPLPDVIALASVAVTGNPFRDVPPVTTLDELVPLERRGVPGSARFTRALPWVREGSVSRPEALIDLAIRASGLPVPCLNTERFDSRGRSLGFSDADWPEYRTSLEFESSWHADVTRMRQDLRRGERWADEGWNVIHAVSDDLFDDLQGLVDRIARRLRSRGWCGREHLPRWVHFTR